MRSKDWDRSSQIFEIRERIWQYLSPTSVADGSGLLQAAGLLGWPLAQALEMAHLQFILAKETREFLEAVPGLLRRLSTTTYSEVETAEDRLLGPIQWSRTFAQRATTGSAFGYVTAPARRGFQTPENELLVHVLDGIRNVGLARGWDAPRLDLAGIDRIVQDRVAAAQHWRGSHMLAQVERVPPTPRAVSRVRSGRGAQRYGPVLAAYDKLHSLVEQVDRQAIREAVEKAGLVAAADPTLFELSCTFGVIDALRAIGWQTEPFHIFRGQLRLRARRADGRRLILWYQATPRALVKASRYRSTLIEHGFTGPVDLRPDMVLHWEDAELRRRWLVVECKLSTKHGPAVTARRALVDLLSYQQAYSALKVGPAHPFGLGIAWGLGLKPAASTRLMLCTQDQVARALDMAIT